jgi:DNA-binding NarL/FixJ family response regulator
VKSIDCANTTEEAFDLALKNYYDIVLLDSSISGGTGMRALDQIKSEQPDLPVIMMSTLPERICGVQAMNGGASGYLDMTLIAENLIEAVGTVLRGEKYVSSNLKKWLSQ